MQKGWSREAAGVRVGGTQSAARHQHAHAPAGPHQRTCSMTARAAAARSATLP